jgi:hypothetical protein
MWVARTGIIVWDVEIPVTPKHPGEIADRMLNAIGSFRFKESELTKMFAAI